jgi:hypothetical protein
VESAVRLKIALLLPPLLACGLTLVGCRATSNGNGDTGAGGVGIPGGGDVDALVSELKSFTDEMAGKVESAQDPKTGVAEAQKILDARRASLAAKIAAVRDGSRQDASAKRKLLEAEVENTSRVHGLSSTLFDASARDPDFKARLDKLIGDYDSMFKESTEH